MRVSLKYFVSMLAIAGMLGAGILGAQQAQPGDLRPQNERQQDGALSRSGGAVDVTRAAPARLPTGIALKENARTAAVEEAVRDVLRTATNAAMKGNMNKLIEQLSHPDRKRLEAQTPVDLNPLTQALGLLNKGYNEVYGVANELTTKDLMIPRMTVTVGEIADPATLTNWPLDPLVGTRSVTGAQEPAVDRGILRTIWRGAARTASGVLDRDYLAKGRDMAVVVLPPAGNIPELTISMDHEAIDFWKIDIPDNVDLATLERNLSDQISKFSRETKTWPPDRAETDRILSRRVLMALYDVEASDAQGGAPGSSETTAPTR